MGCDELEISQPAIQSNPLNYLSSPPNLIHLTWWTRMGWVRLVQVGQFSCQAVFFFFCTTLLLVNKNIHTYIYIYIYNLAYPSVLSIYIHLWLISMVLKIEMVKKSKKKMVLGFYWFLTIFCQFFPVSTWLILGSVLDWID